VGALSGLGSQLVWSYLILGKSEGKFHSLLGAIGGS
jgi:hypothetical protein